MALLRTYIHIHPVLPTSFLLVLVQSFSVVLIVFLSFSICIVNHVKLPPRWFHFDFELLNCFKPIYLAFLKSSTWVHLKIGYRYENQVF